MHYAKRCVSHLGIHRDSAAAARVKAPKFYDANLAARLELMADLFIVSKVALTDGDASGEPEVAVAQAPGTRCERCWRWYEKLVTDDLCRRCAGAVATAGERAVQ